MGKFQVTQEFKGTDHDGLDLVGLDSKEIHATVNGVVHYAGWENPKNHSQGFGQYVCIKGDDGKFYYYGHMSEIKAKTGDKVKCTDVIGIEGDTGYSFGSHCHYCIRPSFSSGRFLNVSEISGIPNQLGTYDDGYLEKVSGKKEVVKETPKAEVKIDTVPDPKTTEKSSPNHDAAMSFDESLAGAYAVTPLGGLNVRKGAGITKERITTLPWNNAVQCFGYYTEVNGVKWFLIQSNGFEGFVCSQYLAKR